MCIEAFKAESRSCELYCIIIYHPWDTYEVYTGIYSLFEIVPKASELKFIYGSEQGNIHYIGSCENTMYDSQFFAGGRDGIVLQAHKNIETGT